MSDWRTLPGGEWRRLLAAPVYNKFRDDVEELIKRIPNVGQKGYQLTRRIVERAAGG